jgi:hypothetical protein
MKYKGFTTRRSHLERRKKEGISDDGTKKQAREALNGTGGTRP